MSAQRDNRFSVQIWKDILTVVSGILSSEIKSGIDVVSCADVSAVVGLAGFSTH